MDECIVLGVRGSVSLLPQYTLQERVERSMIELGTGRLRDKRGYLVRRVDNSKAQRLLIERTTLGRRGKMEHLARQRCQRHEWQCG
jgi:hypothetical protein